MQFRDRYDAGRQLADRLRCFVNRPDVCALALPRGGVPVAFEVAIALRIPLDVLVVRKIGAPSQPELAIGAIASGGVELISDKFVRYLRLSPEVIQASVAHQRLEAACRERAYRGRRPPLDIAGKTVLLIDDGVATGACMQVAVSALRQRMPTRIVVAVPVVERRIAQVLAHHADEVVAVLTPEKLSSVGEWYGDFTQTTDGEVCDLLDKATVST